MLSNLHPNDPRIQLLVHEYLHRNLSTTDIEKLEQWIEADPRNKKAFIEAGLASSSEVELLTNSPKKYRRSRLVAILGCIGVVLVLGWVVYGAFINRQSIKGSDLTSLTDQPFTYGTGISIVEDSLLQFKKATITDIMKAVEYHCHTNVVYASDTPQGRYYSGRIDFSIGTRSVVNILNGVGINVTYDGEQIVVSNE